MRVRTKCACVLALLTAPDILCLCTHRNTLLVYPTDSIQDPEVMLCDLDAAAPIGSVRSARQKPGSSGYFAPEVERWVLDTNDRGAHAHTLKCTARERHYCCFPFLWGAL